MSTSSTDAPRSSSAAAMPLPTPCAAPVTIATCPRIESACV